MKTQTSSQRTVKRLVVVFDICSSTLILEDLLRTENQQLWRNLLVSQKNLLRNKREELNFEMYKFLGDGWILLFNQKVNGIKLFDFLKLLSLHFFKRYKQLVEPVINSKISYIGLTFGIDKGTLIYMTMNGRREYIGRPLNVATRLQGSIKDKDPLPQYKVLMSKSVYADFGDKVANRYSVQNVTRTLRNISGGEKYLCKKLKLINA